MNKKFLSLVLALVMVLGTFTSVFAAEAKEPTSAETKIQWLIDNKYVEGRKVNEDPKNNDLALDKTIKRSEVTKLLVYAIGRQDLAEKIQGTFKPYPDVDNNYWANGVITVGSTMPSPANNIPFIVGYPDGNFKPEKDVTYAELAKMLVTLVKKDLTKDMHDQANNDWPRQWMRWAADLGILDGVDIKNSNDPAIRENAFVMFYNAFYTNTSIKKVPANETLGIVSQLSNNKLTLNQGDFKKEFTLDPNTTYVLYNRNLEQVGNAIKVSALTNPEYFYGSLVRVLADDKGNVTHILELGNPDALALSGAEGVQEPKNVRWADVAKGTFETDSKATTPVRAFVNAGKSISVGTAYDKIDYTANLTSATRYFVADVNKNQLTEVKNFDAAIKILGYEYADAKTAFDHVYVGFDAFGGAEKDLTSGNTAILGYREAKVVVFNKVNKSNFKGELLRVLNETNTKLDIVLENTKGERIVKNVAGYRWAFPFNINGGQPAKWDVIDFAQSAIYGEAAQIVIDHSNTNKFPIVEVIDVDGRLLTVKDVHGERAVLLMDSGWDQFLETQKLEGKKIQFRTLANNAPIDPDKALQDVNQSNVVDVISILPDDFKLEGALDGITEANQRNQFYGKVGPQDIVANGDYTNLIIDAYRDMHFKDLARKNVEVRINNTEAAALQAMIDAELENKRLDRNVPASDKDGFVEIRFKVREEDNNSTYWRAYDVEVLNPQKDTWIPIRKYIDEAGDLTDLGVVIDRLEKLPTLTDAYMSNPSNFFLLSTLNDAYNALTEAEKNEINKENKDKIDAFVEYANRIVEEAKAKVGDVTVTPAFPTGHPTEAELEAEVKALVEAQIADPNVDVTVAIDPAKISTDAGNHTVPAVITLSSITGTADNETVTINANYSVVAMADTYAPVGAKQTVEFGADQATVDAAVKAGVQNLNTPAPALAEGTDYTLAFDASNVKTDQLGQLFNVPVTVNYKDGSVDTVTVPVEIIHDLLEAGTYEYVAQHDSSKVGLDGPTADGTADYITDYLHTPTGNKVAYTFGPGVDLTGITNVTATDGAGQASTSFAINGQTIEITFPAAITGPVGPIVVTR